MAAMKYGMRCCRLIRLAAGTSAGIQRFSFAKICVSALSATKTGFPFFLRKEFQTIFLIGKIIRKRFYIKLFK
jgi:hypothetical protein